MREHTGVVEDTTVTYVVKGLLELMRDTVATAKQTARDALHAEIYAEQVELEYALTHALRDIERLEHEILALKKERKDRLGELSKSATASRVRFFEAQKGYVTPDDVHDARQEFEEARLEDDAAEQKKNAAEEALWAAEEEAKAAKKRREETHAVYQQVRERLVAHQRNGTHTQEAHDDYHRSRTEYRKQHTRLEMDQADVEKDYASKISELRQQQDKIAVEAKKLVVTAETTFAKATPAALLPGAGNVSPIIKAAGAKP